MKRMISIWAIYLRCFLRLAPIPTIIFAVISYPSGVSAQPCDEIDKLITSTPAPPRYPGGWSVYLEELKFAKRKVVDLVLIGDSLAQAWDTKMWSPMRVVNLGVAGDRTQDVLWRLGSREWQKLRPHKVLIILGTNNLNSDKVCAINFGLVQVFKRVAAIWPSTQIGFLEIPPRGPQFLDYNDSRTQINATVRHVPGVKAINVDDAITCGWHISCQNYLNDTVHFTEAGYRVIFKSVMSALFGSMLP
jgi:lysophospholipase L1-like esterase